jgi:heme exporter protein A
MAQRQALDTALSIEQLTIVRGNRMVLRGFSCSAGPGEIIWIKGANGVGKSTLLRSICGLLPSITGTCAVRGKIALIDESIALDPDQTPDEALRFWARFDNNNGEVRESALEAFDLIPLADIPIRILSAGQRRRVALARLIASGTDLWLLDEPYNGLDQANSARLDTAISAHCSRGGIAVIASHIAPGIGVSQSISLDLAAKAIQ